MASFWGVSGDVGWRVGTEGSKYLCPEIEPLKKKKKREEKNLLKLDTSTVHTDIALQTLLLLKGMPVYKGPGL